MQHIANFIARNKHFLLFLVLFSISILLTTKTYTDHRTPIMNSANFLTGGLYRTAYRLGNYLDLESQNRNLAEENNRLKAIVYNSKIQLDTLPTDRTSFEASYRFTTANVIKNSCTSPNNILLIDKGANDGIKSNFGVISSNGLVGIVDKTSKRYATVISILNIGSHISAKLKKTGHFGSLTWNARTTALVQLVDIPRTANVVKGDSVVTSGYSSIFPEGIPIGTVERFKLDRTKNYYIIDVKLFNDMTSLKQVSTVENVDRREIEHLLSE